MPVESFENRNPASADDSWHRVQARLLSEIGEISYRAWLKPMSFAMIDGDELHAALPTPFLRDYVRGLFGDRITQACQAEFPGVRRVRLISVEGRRDANGQEPSPNPVAPADVRGESGNELDAKLDPRFTFDAFVVGKPNEFAYACARRVAEKPFSREFNPLFLYSGVGLGKTHLMQAIGWEMMARNERANGRPLNVVYMSAERFMYRFIASLRANDTMEFKRQLRNVDVLMIDDIQFLIGKDNTQEEFFHTFNYLTELGKQIVVSSDQSPTELALEERLKTRLGVGTVADLHATTYELRLSILQAKAARAAGQIPPKVLELLAHKIATNVRELEGALQRLINYAEITGEAITLETVPLVLRDLLRAYDKRLTMEDIQKKVAEHYHLRMADMTSARRSRQVARPRQVAMYLCKQLTSRSLPEIGKKFGGRDHTTVMHAVARIRELMDADATLREDVELLQRLLES